MTKKNSKENVKIKFVSKALKDDVELYKAMETSKSLEHDITFVQETHRTGSDILDFEDGWKFLHSLRHEHAKGVGMIISPNTIVNNIEYVMDSHIVHALLTLNGIKISAICAYNDRECSTESSNSMLFSKLKKTIAITKVKYPEHRTLVVGNFNNLIEIDNLKLKYIDKIDDELDVNYKRESNYNKLCTLCEDLQLYVLNTIPQDERINSFTWKHPTGYIRHIDHFLADYLMTQCTTNCIAYRDGNEGHETSEILLVLGLECSTFTYYLEQLLTDIKDEVDSDMMEDVEVVETKKRTSLNVVESKRPPPWYDDKYQHLLQTMKKCKDVSEKKNLKKRIKKERMRLKSAFYKQKAATINHATEMRIIQEEFRKVKDFKVTKKFKLSEEPTPPCPCPTHSFQDEYEKQPELIHPENFPFLQPDVVEPIDDSPPTEQEINTAIKNIIMDKCRETDRNYNEHREYINSAPFLQLIISLMRAIWSVIMYPACWLHSRICCLLKNSGCPNAVKNYQGLSMSAALNKILTSVILGRIRNLYESNIMECQFGFRKNRSSTDAIFTIRKVLEYTDGFYVACFVDLGSAYNHINCDSLFDVLEIRTGSKLVGQLIREMYCNTTAAMHSAKETIRTFVGCTQAAQESPCLFKIYLDFVLRICQHEVVQKYPNSGLTYNFVFPPECANKGMAGDASQPADTFTLRLLACADDIMVLSRDVTEMEEIMQIYYRVFKRFGLTLDIEKIKTIVFNASEEAASKESVISIEGSSVENVRQFRFLGYVISNIDHNEYLEQHITSAFRKWSEMENILTDREIQLSIRIHLLETFVRSRLLYSVQARRPNALDMRKVDGIWINLLRRMVKGGFKRQNDENEDVSYIYSNNEISKIANSQPLSTFCETQYLKYIAHAIRQHDSFYPKIMLFAVPEKKHVRDEWTFLEKSTGLDKINLRRIMMDKKKFSKWLYER